MILSLLFSLLPALQHPFLLRHAGPHSSLQKQQTICLRPLRLELQPLRPAGPCLPGRTKARKPLRLCAICQHFWYADRAELQSCNHQLHQLRRHGFPLQQPQHSSKSPPHNTTKYWPLMSLRCPLILSRHICASVQRQFFLESNNLF